MKRNGMHMLDFRVPAVVGTQLTYLDARRYLGQLVAICFLPHGELVVNETLHRQAERFQETQTALLLVSFGCLFHRFRNHLSEKRWPPILADPCGRLHRSFGVAATEPSSRCHTFVVDRQGTRRLAVTHDFTESDLDLLRRIVGRSRLQGTEGRMDEEKEAGETRACLQA